MAGACVAGDRPRTVADWARASNVADCSTVWGNTHNLKPWQLACWSRKKKPGAGTHTTVFS